MKTQPITDLANVISTQTGGVIPTQKPGVIYVPGRDQKTGQGDFVQLSDLRVGRIYDRVAMGTAITAGQEFQFFSNIGGKNLLQTNLQQDSQLPRTMGNDCPATGNLCRPATYRTGDPRRV